MRSPHTIALPDEHQTRSEKASFGEKTTTGIAVVKPEASQRGTAAGCNFVIGISVGPPKAEKCLESSWSRLVPRGRLARKLWKLVGDDRPVGAPGMAATDEERPLAGDMLVFQRIAAFRIPAVGHGLEQRGHGRTEQ